MKSSTALSGRLWNTTSANLRTSLGVGISPTYLKQTGFLARLKVALTSASANTSPSYLTSIIRVLYSHCFVIAVTTSSMASLRIASFQRPLVLYEIFTLSPDVGMMSYIYHHRILHLTRRVLADSIHYNEGFSVKDQRCDFVLKLTFVFYRWVKTDKEIRIIHN